MSNTVKEVDESLELLKETKSNIRSAIEQKGVTVSDTDTFASYAAKIGEISGGSEIAEKNEFVANSNSSASENQKKLYLWEGTVKDYNSQDKEIYALRGIPNRVDTIPVLESLPLEHGTILKDDDFLLCASFELLKIYPSLKKTENLPNPFSDGYVMGVFKEGNKYIAANAHGPWATSTDLVNWQQCEGAPTLEHAYSGAVINGTWLVFEGDETGKYEYSTDSGQTWIAKETGVEYGSETIVLNDRLFLLSANNAMPKVTTDGINWTTCNVNIDPDIYVNGVYYGHMNTTIYSSTDGITWTSTSMVLPEQPEYNSHLGHNGTHFLYATVTHAYWSVNGINWNSKELAILQYNNGMPVAYDWHGHDIVVFNESWSENIYVWSIFDINGYVYTAADSNSLKVHDRIYDYNMNDVGQITSINQTDTNDSSTIDVTLLSNETYSTVRNTTADFTAAVPLEIVNPDVIAIINNTNTNEFVTIKQNGKDLSNSLYALKPNDITDLLSTGKINDMDVRSGTDFIHPKGCIARYIDYDTLGIKNLISNSIIETVLYGNGIYLAHYYDGIYTSTDLINWEKPQTDFSVYGNIIFDGEKFVGIMAPKDTGYPTIYTSVDGKSWERGTQLASSSIVWYGDLCYNGKGYLITEHSTSSAAYPVVFSTDLVNWTKLNPGNDPADYYHTCAANSQAFVVAISETNINKVYVSTNGTNWTTVTLPEKTNYNRSLRVLNDTFIYKLSTNTYKSTDGRNWTRFDYTLNIPTVYYDGNYYISDAKAIYKSPDALTWEVVSGTEQYNNSNSTGGLETITSNGVMVIATGTSGATISDGNYTYFKPLNETGKTLHLYQNTVQTIESGSANGTISVDGTDVAVKGLGTAAYTASSAYATSAQGAKADTALQNTATGTNALTLNSVNTSNLNETVNIGYNSRVGSQRTVAIGSESYAQGIGAVALGYGAKAQVNGFAALGQSYANSAHIIGRGNNTETNTFKVALVGDSANIATDEASGLYTLLNSDGSVPLDRTFNTLLYHDLFAFQRNGMTIIDNMTTADGETWTESDRDFHKLFICKDTDAPISVLTANEIGHTFTLDTMDFSYSNLEYIEFGTNRVPTPCDFNLKIEFSTDKESWTAIVEKTGLQSQKTYFYKFDQPISGQCRYIKFTFIKTTNLDTGIVNVNTLKGYTKRIGEQGGGRDTILPFSWDDDNIIYPSKLNSTTSLGKFNSRWYSIYGGNLYGWNLHASSNIYIGGDNGLPERGLSGVYHYQVYNKNTNNYPYHRIAKIDWTDKLKAYADGCAYIEIMSYYKDGKYGRIKASIRSNEKTTDPFAQVEIIWIDRQGFKVDDVQGALYTITDGDNSRTYLDVFLKLDHPWETYSLKFTKGDRGDLFGDLDYANNNELFQVLSSSEEMNNSTITECYTAIQGNEAGTAAYDLHNGTQYTTIVNGVDSKIPMERMPDELNTKLGDIEALINAL